MDVAASVITRSNVSTVPSIVKMSRREKSDHRRKKLRRNLMTLVVTRCLQGKHCNLPMPTSSQLEQLEQQVDEYLDREQLSDAVVNALAASLRKMLISDAPRSVTAPPPNIEHPTSLPPLESVTPSPRSEPAAAKGTSTLLLQNNRLARSTKPTVVKRRENLVSDEQWNENIRHDMENYQKEQRDLRKKQVQKMEQCKQSLDEQVAYNERMKRQAQEANQIYATAELRKQAEWENQVREQAQIKRSNAAREKIERDEQLTKGRLIKQNEDKKKRDIELEYRSKIREEECQQSERERSKKAAHMEAYRQFMTFNIAEQQKKKQQLEQERLRDKQMLEAHSQLLDQQAKNREAWQKKFARSSPNTDYFKQLTANQTQKVLAENARIEREVAAMEEKRESEERIRTERALTRKKQFIETLNEQLREKESQKAAKKRSDVEFRKHQEKELQASVRLEQLARQEKKKDAKKHLLHLDKQVEERHRRNMTDLQVGIARWPIGC
eukprot:TRINITY_DN11293_c0_g2_i1.p1 TRINITY_DN11293_c0_g2~~TRINITY_DN11293_c0_g2_i1.p1  ORF type:complete len:497 (+),score=129.90 TRINITY_DN11293_c0_g2_i1:149-1639(+)